tara:strand:+ start:157 stop:1869 length:1713 start_codon:yes stop_codon:yes gene_type:complete
MKKKTLQILFTIVPIFVYSQSANVEWIGAGADNNWSTTGNWSTGSLPSNDDNVYSLFDDYTIVIDRDVKLNRISNVSGTINLIINAGKSLEVSSYAHTVSGTITLNSNNTDFASFLSGNSVDNTMIYNRWVNGLSGGSGWDLVGSPLSSVTISSITGDSDLATNGSNPTTYALGSFSNTDISWTNVDSNDTSGTLTSGQGYQMATTSGGTITFQGSLLTTTQSISIYNNNPNETSDSNLTGSRWNLIANPFPSYINANNNANANNFLSDNAAAINDSYEALYGYNANGGYTEINNTSSATYIAPGQGFFVASVVGGGTITFDANTRTTTGGDDFVANRMANTSQEFYLRLYENDNLIEDNKFYFDNGLTLGLDRGYDAGAFDQNMDIMSRLPENDQGVGFSINAMGLNSLEANTVIPLVFNRASGIEFSVSFEDASIPEGVGIYLQDTLLETLTDLRAENFTLTPELDLSDMGRFYIVIGNTSLSGNDLEASYISIYKAASEDHINIEGLLNIEKANVQLFNIIGQEVLNTTLNSNQSTQRVSTSGLTTGVYVIRLEADSSVIAKKIIIN